MKRKGFLAISIVILLGVILIYLLVSFDPEVAGGEETAVSPLPASEIKTNETCVLRVAGAGEWEPVHDFTETGELEGIAADVIRRISQELNLPVDFKAHMPWDRMLIEVEKGNIDIVAGAYWTEERSQKYYYSIPFAYDEIRVFVLKGNEFPLNRLEDLIGRVGGRPDGGSYGEVFDQFANEHLDMVGVPTDEQLIEQLLLGHSDYIVLAYWDGLSTITNLNVADQIVVLPYSVAINEIYLMLSRRSPCTDYLDAINQVIKQMKEEGELSTIVAGYAKKEGFAQAQSLIDSFAGVNNND